MVLKYNPT